MPGSPNYAEETCPKNHDSSRSLQNAGIPEEPIVHPKQGSEARGHTNEKEALDSPCSSDTTSADQSQDRDGKHHGNNVPTSPNVSALAPALAPLQTTPPISNNAPGEEDDDSSFPEGGLHAWLVVLGSFSAQFTIYGIINSTGALQAYLLSNQLRATPPE